MASRIHRCLALGALVGLAAGCTIETGTQSVQRDAAGEGPPVPGGVTVDPASLRTLTMVGDSITVMSTPELEESLAGTGLDAVIDAQVGRRMTERSLANGTAAGEDVVRFVQGGVEPPDVWVIALGANDIAQYPDADAYREQVSEVLDEIPAEAPLLWVNAYYEDYRDQCVVFDAVVRSLLDRRGNAMVADWFEAAEEDGVLTADGVHPTTDGTEVFADVVAEGVDALLASL